MSLRKQTVCDACTRTKAIGNDSDNSWYRITYDHGITIIRQHSNPSEVGCDEFIGWDACCLKCALDIIKRILGEPDDPKIEQIHT